MVKGFKITLTNLEGKQFYLSEQELTGLVQFTLSDAKSYDHVEIKLIGKAKVKWSVERQTGINNSVTDEYSAEETYIDDTKILWTKRRSPDGKIGPGDVSLPFQFILPSNCQSSFPKGHILLAHNMCVEYSLHAKIATDKRLTIEPRCELPIKVQRITDTNRPDLMLPSHQSDHSEVGCMCCSSGEMSLTVNVPRTACCIGTSVPLTVNVENSSTNSFNVSAKIFRTWTFLASGQMRQCRCTIVYVESPLISPNSQYTWEVNNLLIPFDTLPTMEGSNIIKTEDTLDVKAHLPWTCGNTSVTFPLFIGNVPLRY